MKKKIIVSAVLIAVVLIYLILCYGPLIQFQKERLTENEEAYNDFALFCYECYTSDCKSGEIYSYAIDRDNPKELICYTTDVIYSLNKKQAESAKIVCSTYSVCENTLDRIYIADNFVILGIVNGRGSLIYSINKKKPKFVNHPDEERCSIFVEKITDHWYYVCKQD